MHQVLHPRLLFWLKFLRFWLLRWLTQSLMRLWGSLVPNRRCKLLCRLGHLGLTQSFMRLRRRTVPDRPGRRGHTPRSLLRCRLWSSSSWCSGPRVLLPRDRRRKVRYEVVCWERLTLLSWHRHQFEANFKTWIHCLIAWHGNRWLCHRARSRGRPGTRFLTTRLSEKLILSWHHSPWFLFIGRPVKEFCIFDLLALHLLLRTKRCTWLGHRCSLSWHILLLLGVKVSLGTNDSS